LIGKIFDTSIVYNLIFKFLKEDKRQIMGGLCSGRSENPQAIDSSKGSGKLKKGEIVGVPKAAYSDKSSSSPTKTGSTDHDVAVGVSTTTGNEGGNL
jgi:hypothetical protein